ncbi:MAG: cation:proton antiporter subunit C [Firmicutes bacterium]|nr:cation:proton antiporter subunit C [Bacillota bacterium]
MMEFIFAKYHYWISILLMMIGFYAVVAKSNLVKKIIGLNIFQTSVFLFYVSMAKVEGGTAPILWAGAQIYDNPLPHTLMLTGIVVSVSTTAVALAIIIMIKRAFGTVEEDEILEIQEMNKYK